MNNTINKIVKNNMCIGCGMCAALCPNTAITMKFNQQGEYNPYLKEKKCSNCGVCLGVCPFANNYNEYELAKEKFSNKMNFNKNLGFYLNTYSGYIKNDFREKGASGGITTWLLIELLKNNYIDYVINVKPNNDSKKLFKYQITDNIENIKKSAGSVYYPVELSKVIKKVLKQKGEYAIVGLPCFLKALELAKKKNNILKKRIVFSIGLVCGQLKNKEFTHYIAKLSGVKGNIKRVSYRNNDDDKPAYNYYYHFKDNNSNSKKSYFQKTIKRAWSNRWFTPNACNYCDDIFAELADVTLMDAWLPEFKKNSRGTNLLIVRNEKIKNVLLKGKKNKKIKLDYISPHNLISSQQGVVNIKKNKLSYRLSLKDKNDRFYPQKRVKPCSDINIFFKKEVQHRDKMQKLSKKLWQKYKKNKITFEDFNNTMQKELSKLKKWSNIKKFFLLIKRILKK